MTTPSICAFCSSPIIKEYARFNNETQKDLKICSRKCFVVFQSHMRADEVDSKQRPSTPLPKKKVTFMQPLFTDNKDQKK